MNLDAKFTFKIVGITLMVIGVSMLPSVFVSLIYDTPAVLLSFLATSLSAIVLGRILLQICRHSLTRNLKIRDGFLIVIVCWLVSAVLGAIPFYVTGSIPNPFDAFFESCSGFSTTGSSILEDIEVLPRGILFWRSFTHWIGGMGILVFAIALLPSLGISGQNVAVSESTGPTLTKPSSKMTDVAKGLYLTYLLFTIIETILLMFGGMNLYDALLHTFGSVGTGGFSSYNDSVGHYDSTYIDIVITVFMLLCGVNFNLYILSLRRGFRAFWEDAELRLYLAIIAVSSVAICVTLLITQNYTSVKDAAVDSTFQTVSILTTTGYATADYETWPMFCQMIIFLLMLIGGCSSSTGGGLKVIRVLVIFKLIRRGISTRLHPHVVETIKPSNQNMPPDVVSAIASHMFLFIVMIFCGAFIISFENCDLATCFSAVITALGNVGPGFGMIGPTENFSLMSNLSKFVLSIYMIAGRLELYTLFILLTPGFWNSNH